MRIVVLLPEPLAPRNAKIVPGSTASESASTAVKSPKRLREARRADDGRRSRGAPAAPARASAASMSTGSGSARTRRRQRRERGPARACGPGARARLHLDAGEASARPRTRHDVGQRARRAGDRAGLLAPDPVELDGGHARRSSAGVPGRDHAAGVEVDEPLARLRLVEVARRDEDQRRRAPLRRGARRSPPAPPRRHPRSARRARRSAGSGSSAFAIASFCFMPPESAPAGRSRERRRGRCARAARRLRASNAGPGRRCRRPVKARFSRTESSRCRPKICGT